MQFARKSSTETPHTHATAWISSLPYNQSSSFKLSRMEEMLTVENLGIQPAGNPAGALAVGVDGVYR